MHTYSHVALEVSREAADQRASVLWPDDEDQAAEPGTAEPDKGRTATEGRYCSGCLLARQGGCHREACNSA
jgi:hypothetical protein